MWSTQPVWGREALGCRLKTCRLIGDVLLLGAWVDARDLYFSKPETGEIFGKLWMDGPKRSVLEMLHAAVRI